MIFYGMELASGTTFKNLTCEGGTAFPTTNLQQGRLFYHTSQDKLYVYDGSNWDAASGASAAGVTSFNNRTGAVTLVAADLPKASTTAFGAVKVGTGLSVSGGIISANSIEAGTIIPAGSKLLWAQPAAPTGWTQVTSTQSDNRFLRVVDVAGGTTGSGGTGGYGYGGTDDPLVMNKVPSHTHAYSGDTSTTGNHTHNVLHTRGGSPDGGGPYYQGATVDSNVSDPTSAAGSHAHSFSGTTNANGAADTWTPRYLNLILCTKD